MIKRQQFNARTSSACELNMAVIQVAAAATGLSVADYIEQLIRAILRKIRTGEIDKAHLQDSNDLDKVTRCMLPVLLIDEMGLAGGRFGVGAADIFRAAIRYEPELRDRLRLEKLYTEAGASGNPVFMSDTFLQLWERNHGGRANAVEVEIFRHVRPLQVELAELRTTINSLLSQKEDRPTGSKPCRQDIIMASAATLRDIAREWGFEIPKKSKIAIARRQALTHFGYATTE